MRYPPEAPDWWDAEPADFWANEDYYLDRENFDEHYGDEIDGFAIGMHIEGVPM